MLDQRSQALVKAAADLVGEFELSHQSSAAAVGCALRTRSGDVFTGICMQLSCGIGSCAEHGAVSEMLKHRHTDIEEIVAVGRDGVLPPCGRCRELLVQVSGENLKTRVIVDESTTVELSELLPLHWLEIKAKRRALKAG